MLELSKALWDNILYPVGYELFQNYLGDKAYIGGRPKDHLEQPDKLDNLLTAEMLEKHIKYEEEQEQRPLTFGDEVDAAQFIGSMAIKIQTDEGMNFDLYKNL